MIPTLKGKVALVTSAASGIGASIAQQLAGAGYIVHVTDRDAEGAHAHAASLERPMGWRMDVRDVAEVGAVIQAIRARDGGIGKPGQGKGALA